jgi:hypothetical protein
LEDSQRGTGGFGSTDTKQSPSGSTPKSLEDLLKIKEAQFQVGQKYSDAIKERDSKIFNK